MQENGMYMIENGNSNIFRNTVCTSSVIGEKWLFTQTRILFSQVPLSGSAPTESSDIMTFNHHDDNASVS